MARCASSFIIHTRCIPPFCPHLCVCVCVCVCACPSLVIKTHMRVFDALIHVMSVRYLHERCLAVCIRACVCVLLKRREAVFAFVCLSDVY
jgi:hypothetical protein